jgi:photosystem II stability/assembly factor-like uncharacterized protein
MKTHAPYNKAFSIQLRFVPASLLIFVAACMLSVSDIHAQYPWIPLQSGTDADLVAVSFVDDQHGYIATEEGDVLTSFDGGLLWHPLSGVENFTPTRLQFTDHQNGWMVGNYKSVIDSAGIYHTTDGGSSWQAVFQAGYMKLFDVQFLSETTGWVAGYDNPPIGIRSLMMYTTSEGFSWEVPFSARVLNPLYSIHFRNDLEGTSCGQDGVFFQTYNGGMDETVGWSMNLSIPSYGKDLYRIFNSSPAYGVAVGEDGMVLVTTNNWQAHQDHTVSSGDTLTGLTGFSDIPQFYAVGKNGCVASIRYGLFMWMISEETRVTSEHLNDVCQVDDLHTWAVGDNGTILYHTNNYPPVAVDDMGSVRQDSSLQIHVLDNDTDMDFDPLEIYDYWDGKHGVLVHPEGEDYLEFFPDDDYVGMDTLTYVVTDNKLGFDTAHIYVEIREAPTGPFTRIEIPHDTVAFGSSIWGDIDNDDDYDIIACGEQADGKKVTGVFHNEGGTFERSEEIIEGVRPGNGQAMAFTDLDRDGYLDIIVTGENNDGIPSTLLYLFYFPTEKFILYDTDIPGVVNGSVDWGDYDHDGDQDLLIMGNTGSGKICEIFRNDGEADVYQTWEFIPANKNFHGLDHGAARFVDFNHDGYMDVVSTGTNVDAVAKTYYYTNQYGLYMVGELDGYENSTIDVCDFNADRQWDVLLTGTRSEMGPHAGLLTYTDSFNELASTVAGVNLGSTSWGDFDNDGDFDLVVCGMNDQLAPETQLYINNDGVLESSGYFLPGMASGTVKWGDYDADGDLDLLMSGYFNTEPNRITTILRNDLETPNELPEAPDHFSIEGGASMAALKWSPGRDEETAEVNMAYNFKLKRKKYNSYMIEPASDDSLVLEIPGYASLRDTAVYIEGLIPGTIYECEIQSVDAGFHVSPWKKFQFNAPSYFLWEQDFGIDASEINSAEWFYPENKSLPVLLLTELFDSAATLLQWNGSEFDTLARYPYLGSGIGKVALMDFNRDNEVDFSEYHRSDTLMTIYISSGDTLRFRTETPADIYDWGDYDRDGDPDLIITGMFTDDPHCASIYRNDGTGLEHMSTLIPGVMDGDIAWVDIDGDGDEDVVVSGLNKELGLITRTYENLEGVFVEKQTDLPGLWYTSFDFADYDADGDLDMLLCGRDGLEPMTRIYTNKGGEFEERNYGLAPLERGSCRWVDLYMDGRPDIVLLGYQTSDAVLSRKTATIYLYDDGAYSKQFEIEGVPGPIIAPGDFNGDGYPDLAFAGIKGGNSNIVIYKNNNEQSPLSAGPPRNLSVLTYGDSVLLTWDYPEGLEPPEEVLTFNLRVGTSPGANDILSPLADASGSRKVVQQGNVPAGTSRPLHGLSPDSTYYAAVQAVEPAFYGSPFTGEIVFNPLSGTLLPGEVLYSQGLQLRYAGWADLDSDGDPDLLVKLGNSIIWFENEEGSFDFENFTSLIDGSFSDELLMTDPDKDNDADVLLFSSEDLSVGLLQNNGGVFSTHSIEAEGLYNADVALADLNNDGSEDMVLMGTEQPGTSLKTLIYQQEDDGYRSLSNLIVPTYNGELHVVDINRDGDLELVHCGVTVAGSDDPADYDFIINENIDGAFVEVYNYVPGLKYADIAFGDYDDDGYLDILYTGSHPRTGMPKTFLVRNIISGYRLADSSLVPVFNAAAEWFDYNNDGLMDIVMSGYNDTDDHADDPDANKFGGVYLNRGGTFELTARIPTFVQPVIAVADVDGDGSQDIFLAGHNTTGDTLGILYRNVTPETHIPPEAPQSITPSVDGDEVDFTWARKPLSTNSYNLRVGTSPGASDVVSPLSHADGTRIVFDYGNVHHASHYTLTGLDPGNTYYAAVQAIDMGKLASPWSVEVSFTTVGMEEAAVVRPLFDATVYPVPARGLVHVDVSTPFDGEVDLMVYDPLGRELFQAKDRSEGGTATFQVSVVEPGMYLVKVRSGDRVVVRKIVVGE